MEAKTYDASEMEIRDASDDSKQWDRQVAWLQSQRDQAERSFIPEQLAEYMFVSPSQRVQFTQAGREWLGAIVDATQTILDMPRDAFQRSLLDQVALFDEHKAHPRILLTTNKDGTTTETPAPLRPFDGIWTKARRAELLELLPLLCFVHPELEDLEVEWVAGLLAVSTLQQHARQARRALSKAEKNRKKAERKAERKARKAGRR